MKKRIAITCALWLWVITLIAQTNSLSTLQYWWNDDLLSSIQKTISGSSATLDETADADALKDGLHRLNYRIQDNRGAWSQTVTSYFLKRTNEQATTNSLTILQYWWNDDLANSVQKSVSGSGIVELNELGDATALKDGLHRLNYRIQDNRGAWSQTVTSYFLKRTNEQATTNSLTTLQYWWNDNLANSVQKSISGNGVVELNELGDATALKDGLHRLNYRIQDNRGAWSQTVTSYFLKRTNEQATTNSLTILQYWWNDDLANSVQKSVSGSGIVELNELGDATALKDGLHRLNYRIQDNRGAWSQTVTSYFLKRTNEQATTNSLTILQYWWNDDFANNTQKSISGSGIVELNEVGDATALKDGLHRLHYRVQDNRGAWSQTVTTYFYKTVATGKNGIVGYEYWFKDDKTTTFKSIDKTATAVIIDAADVVHLRNGKHIFHFCAIDANGKRSAVIADTIEVDNRVEIHSQADVERYARYESINANVLISGSGVESLVGLQWKSIDGNLTIDNTSLINLTGLDSLKTIEGNLSVIFNSQLQSLDGLNQLERINSETVTIVSNTQLLSYCALSKYAGKNTPKQATIEYNFYNPLWKNIATGECSVEAAETLILGGEAKTATLERKMQKVYKLSLEKNQTVRISDSMGTADITVSYGQINGANNRQGSVYISNSMQGDYYVLLSNNTLNAQQNQTYSITAREMDMEITEVFADTIVRYKSALIPLEVIGCSEIPQIALVGKDGKHYEAEKVHVFSETLFSAQFNVESLAVGDYGLFVASGEKNGLKEKAIYLKNEVPRESLETKITGLPSVSRVGNTISIYVEYVNTGNVDIPAPLLVLTGPGYDDTGGWGISTFQVGDGEIYNEEIHLMGLNAMGVINTLRPGEGGRIEVKTCIPNMGSTNNYQGIANYHLRVLSHNAAGMDEPFYLQWLDVDPDIKPNFYEQEEWDGYVERLRGLTGDTWGSFVMALSDIEGLLWDNGLATVDAQIVYRYMKELAYDEENTLTKSVLKGGTINLKATGNKPGTSFIWKSSDWQPLVEYKNNEWTVNEGLFNPLAETYFYSHGLNDNYGRDSNAKSRLLAQQLNGKGNVISLDWSEYSYKGSTDWMIDKINTIPALSIPLLLSISGKIHDKFIKGIIPTLNPFYASSFIDEVANINAQNFSKLGLNPSKLHMIGHSHGAHVCAMTVLYLQSKVKRITALDASEELSHTNSFNTFGNIWNRVINNKVGFIDYYKSSDLYGMEKFIGNDNFIVVEKDNGFNPLLSKDIFQEIFAGKHGYAVTWFVNSISNSRDDANPKPGFYWEKGDYENLTTMPKNNKWQGIIHGKDNMSIECLNIKNEISDIDKTKWNYSDKWYSYNKDDNRSEWHFRDALASTFEFDVNDQSITIPSGKIVAGTEHTITLSYSNRADNFTVEQLTFDAFYKNSGNVLFVSKDDKLDASDYLIDNDNLHFAQPGKVCAYNTEVNFSRNLWTWLGGNDETNSIDCYLFFATGITCPKDRLPTTKDLITSWKGELYPENNIVSKKITIYNTDLWCFAGNDQTLTIGKNETVKPVHLSGEAKTTLTGQTKFAWSYNGTLVSDQQSFTYSLPVGTHEFELTISNGNRSATDHVVITIKPSTPPPPCCDGSGSDASTSTIGSWDPNEKVGIKGAGDKNCVLPGTSMDYTIFFENDPENANAPAQEVRVIDVLDEAFDLSTFSFTGVRVANMDIAVQNNVARTSVTTDLRPDNDLLLRTTLNMDIDTRTITATFTSLDPETGEFTTDPWAGFLFPNDDTHRGEGRFSYRVNLKNNILDGDEIKNQAHIYFDWNEPILTNITSHCIDAGKPESWMIALPATTTETSFTVSWNGADLGSGIHYYDIYVKENEGSFIIWKYHTAETSATFTGKADKTYSFYCIATDNVGNVENVKNAETTIKIEEVTQIVITEMADSDIKIYPNPAKDEIFIKSELQIRKVEVCSLTGALLLSENNFNEKISVSALSQGIYLLKVYTDNGVAVSKIVKE